MMKIKKRYALLLACMIALLTPVSVLADREDAILDTPYISLGADLTGAEKATVLQLLGVTEADLTKYKVVQITNAMEHEYLDSYLDTNLIGSRALSSVLVIGKEAGNGIKVTTENISYCTVGMYQNALATAGIQNADIKVVGPFKISGTAGLVGAIKSYENMTGQTVSSEKVETATSELVVTSDLADSIGDSQKAAELVGFIKNEVAANDYSDEDVSKLIDQAAEEMNVTLSASDKEQITGLMDKIEGLDLDVDQLQEQVKGLYDKLEGMGLQLDLNSEETKSFLANLFDKIVEFFSSFTS